MQDWIKYWRETLTEAFVTLGLYFYPICPEFIKKLEEASISVQWFIDESVPVNVI